MKEAQATAGQTPFGGFSLFVVVCTASGGNLLVIHSAVAGPPDVIFNYASSRLYPYGNIRNSGNWLLGNLSGEQECAIWVGPYRVSLGTHPLISLVGTSDPGHVARSGSSGEGDEGDEPAPPDDQELPPEEEVPPPTTPAGACGETPAENGQTEDETRSDLAASGVQVDPALSKTLSPVGKLPNNAISGMKDLKQDCGPNCKVLVTSGARQPGNPTPPGAHGTGKPVFDLNKDKGAGGLDEYIKNNSSRNYYDNLGTHYVMPNGDEYLDENYGATGGTGAHWHVRINANHCPPTA
ncbi:MAG: hypothetical protein WCV68_02940 [Candidatus Paceibacterota bacterium]